MYDVAIVGAGPAGSTLARLIASSGRRILLVDRRRLDEPPAAGGPVKPCGGLLAPQAQKELARQGLGIPGDVALGPQLFAVRTLDLDADLERLYQRFYLNVDREMFDRWLVSLVPPAVDRAFGWSMSRLEADDGEGSTLHFRTALGADASVRARLVVGADGASSVVRRAAFPDAPAPARYAAVQAVFGHAGGDAHYGAIFDSELTDFYGWTIPKGGTTVVGCAFLAGPGTSAAFDEFIDRVRLSGFRIGAEIKREASMVLRPDSPEQLLVGKGSVALLGEAAGFISPSSAEGISYALRSARALAGVIRRGETAVVARYRIAALPLAAEVCARMVKSSAIYGPATRRLVMRSGLTAIRDDSDALIGEMAR